MSEEDEGATALLAAVSMNDLDRGKRLMRNVNVNDIVHSEASLHAEPLFFKAALCDGAPVWMRAMLEVGADPMARANDDDTLLHKMAGSGVQSLDRFAVIRSLVEAGAEVNAKDDKGQTPLDRAIAMTARMFRNARDSRNHDSPELLVSMAVIDFLEANGATMAKRESRELVREVRQRAKQELSVGRSGGASPAR